MGNMPSQNYWVSPKYDVTQFYLQPDITSTPRLDLSTPKGWRAELT